MTADAKIGLLLGLVFIFIIALAINGLRSHPQTANATPPASKSNDLGVAGSAQDAQRKLDWQHELDTGTTTLKVTGNTPVADAPTQSVTPAKDGAGPGQTPALQTLDDSIRNLTGTLAADSTQPKSNLPIDTTIVAKEKVLGPTTATANKDKAAPVVASAKNDKTAPSPTPAVGTKKEAPKEYVVQPGDDLGTIAKKVYGSVGGNVDRIFEFNRSTLKSKDVITVGQKLRIPPLPAATTSATPAKPADVLPAAQFEKVSAIGKPASMETKGSGTSQSLKPGAASSGQSQADGRWYVVQADDNLWKIAANQLGSGARSDEIAKLNAAVLKSKDVLTLGMRLKLPAK